MYYIFNTLTGDFWNNELGWCEVFQLAEFFSLEERQSFQLPIDGQWAEKGKQ